MAWIVGDAEATEAQPTGMGIRFKYASAAERESVHGAVLKLLYSSLGEHVANRLLADAEKDEG
ncbi:MAG: hypothetical protein WCJ30_24915 [Deltaproteobacteria bacterium]